METLEKPTYDKDFALWLTYQAELLRQGRVDEREAYNCLTVLLAHLLKYEFQPGKRTHSWRSTIQEHRRQLKLVFKDSPSLAKNYVPAVLGDIYQNARSDAGDETGLVLETFPETCPYTVKQILGEDFLPEGVHG